MDQYERRKAVPTTEREWIRRAGTAAMVGGAIFTVWTGIASLFPAATASPASTIYLAHYVGLFALATLLLVGAVGLHARYGDRYGRLGLVGVAATGLAFVAMIVGSALQLAVPSAGMEPLPFVGILISLVGMPLLGVALQRAGVLSGLTAALFVSVLPAFVLMFAIGTVVTEAVGVDLAWLVFSVPFGAAWVLAGRQLRSSGDESAIQPHPKIASTEQ